MSFFFDLKDVPNLKRFCAANSNAVRAISPTAANPNGRSRQRRGLAARAPLTERPVLTTAKSEQESPSSGVSTVTIARSPRPAGKRKATGNVTAGSMAGSRVVIKGNTKLDPMIQTLQSAGSDVPSSKLRTRNPEP